VDKVGWPMMHYKISPTYVLWSFKGGPIIRLWKEDVVGHAKLSTRVLNPIPFCLIWGINELKVGEKEKFISSKVLKYIKF
jgi:hypothetical protein